MRRIKSLIQFINVIRIHKCSTLSKGPAMDTSLTKKSSDLDSGSINSIINKPLGHIHSIMFWSTEQKQIYNILELKEVPEEIKSLLIGGDYGVGKTIFLGRVKMLIIDISILYHS